MITTDRLAALRLFLSTVASADTGARRRRTQPAVSFMNPPRLTVGGTVRTHLTTARRYSRQRRGVKGGLAAEVGARRCWCQLTVVSSEMVIPAEAGIHAFRFLPAVFLMDSRFRGNDGVGQEGANPTGCESHRVRISQGANPTGYESQGCESQIGPPGPPGLDVSARLHYNVVHEDRGL